MNRTELIKQIRSKKSFLCVGLDPDLEKLPSHLPKDIHGVGEFCVSIIEKTLEHCVAFKLNTAFFESLGWQGMVIFEEIIKIIPNTHLIIADAKRGDIGNTSNQYAKAFFETMNCDAVTIAPYMGSDSVKPFLQYQNKWAIILGLTSNEGAKDFELQKIGDQYLFERVLETSKSWGSVENMMYVIGATQPEYFERIRKIIPDHFLLIPGVGAQGGSLKDVCQGLLNQDIGILVNSSREIIFADSSTQYAKTAQELAKKTSLAMASYIK